MGPSATQRGSPVSWKEHKVSPNGAVLAQFRLSLAAQVYINDLPPYTCFLFPKMEVTLFLYLLRF